MGYALMIVAIVAGVVAYLLADKKRIEEVNRLEREKDELKHEISALQTHLDETKEKTFENALKNTISLLEVDFKEYSTSELVALVKKHRYKIDIFSIDDIETTRIKTGIRYLIEYEKSVKFLLDVMSANNVAWDYSYSFEMQFDEYLPLHEYTEERALNIINTVLQNLPKE